MDKQKETERIIAEGKAATGRSCGSCSLCCRLLDVPEIGKPEDDWCQHCRPGHGGCAIYDQRPAICRGFACQWLISNVLDDAWFPAKAKIVVDIYDSPEGGMPLLRFHVDPRFPNRWREEPYYSKIKQLALLGLQGRISGEMLQTIISIKGEWTLVMPHREIKYQPGVMLRVGDDSFEYITCKSNDEVLELDGKLKMLWTTIDKIRNDNLDLTPLAAMEIALRGLLKRELDVGN
jgi:hypothetical protein